MDEKKEKIFVSYSQYAMWKNCPLQWKLSYVDGLRERDENINTIFGTAIHETIQYWLGMTFGTLVPPHPATLSDYLMTRMQEIFKKNVAKGEAGETIYPCTKEELIEYYADGLEILGYLTSHQQEFFPTNNFELLGVEVPLDIRLKGKLYFTGYLDVVIKNTLTGQIRILDLKTSKSGWTKWQTDDEKKTDQLLVYKTFYAKKFNVLPEYIGVTFLILKRKLDYEKAKRVYPFKPMDGAQSLRRAEKEFDRFIQNHFDGDGNYVETGLKPTPSTSACRFCQFNDDKEHCQVSAFSV